MVFSQAIKAFRVGCPLVSWETSDPGQTVKLLVEAVEAEKLGIAVLTWDCVRGVCAANVEGRAAIGTFPDASELTHPVEFFKAMMNCQKRVIVVALNAHRFLENVTVVQAIWNLRDHCKAAKKMLILSGPSIAMPMELQHDVVSIVEPLPNSEQLSSVVRTVCGQVGNSVKGFAVSDEEVDAAGAASLGVTAFACENLTSLSVSKEGLSLEGLWSSKRRKIDETDGLQVVTAGSFEDIGGVSQVKKFLTGIMAGNDKPNAIVFVDEIEKMLGGSSSDSSGVSQDQLGTLLSWMQDHRATGCIFVGPPGAAKSAIARASGTTGGIPTIQLDLGAAKGSLVGESERKIRESLKVIDAVSGGKTLWLATCNSLTSLPPELRRRFKLGTWFFDLPDLEERTAIWSLYAKKYELECDYSDLLDNEWTGAEVEACCEIAWKLNVSVHEAAAYIVPVAKAAAETIENLRAGAAGRFLSASHPGVYSREKFANSDQQRNFI